MERIPGAKVSVTFSGEATGPARPIVVDQTLLIIDELGFVPLSRTGAELLFDVFSQRYERGHIMITTDLPFDEWTEVFGSERLTGALLDRLTHHIHILEMNGESHRLKRSRESAGLQPSGERHDVWPTSTPFIFPGIPSL